jgi:hypothetical protein
VYIVHPYLLKEYNQRWYLLCNKQSDIDEKPALVTLSLDRIENISDIQYAFCPAPEGIQEYFDDFIGNVQYKVNLKLSKKTGGYYYMKEFNKELEKECYYFEFHGILKDIKQ